MPQRILFVNHSMSLGGVERSLVSLMDSMPKGGDIQLDLFLFDHSGDLLSKIPPHVNLLPPSVWYSALCLPLLHALFSRQWVVGVSRLWSKFVPLLRRLLGLKPGFLLPRSHRYACAFLPKISGEYDLAISFLTPHDIIIKRVNARKKVGWVHTDYKALETGCAINFEQKAWQDLDQIVAVSSEVADHFGEVFPEISNRVIVIENILNSETIRQRALIGTTVTIDSIKSSGVMSFCTVGRFSYAKGIDLAAEAASKLKDTGFKFRWYVIGYGTDEPMLRKQIVELGIAEEFILVGAIENPYPYIKACDIYVQPSRYEGKCVSIREAQILGKPVLVSNFPTASSQIEHGIDGWIVPPGVDGLVQGLQLLSQDTQLRGQIAQATESRDYSNRLEVQKVLALLPDPIV
jgi:glycosyltransferase involved in cell wall biosynthesis